MKQGDVIESGKNIEIKVGNSLELRDIPPGTSLHNVELIPGNGAKLARSAGSSVIRIYGDYVILKLFCTHDCCVCLIKILKLVLKKSER